MPIGPVGNIFLGRRFHASERESMPAMRRVAKRSRIARQARDAYFARLGSRRQSAFGEVSL